MNYSKSRTKIGCQRTQLEIVEDLDNDFPVQYGTELYRKIIIQVPLEVQKLQIMKLQDVPTDHKQGGQRMQKCAPDKLRNYLQPRNQNRQLFQFNSTINLFITNYVIDTYNLAFQNYYSSVLYILISTLFCKVVLIFISTTIHLFQAMNYLNE